MDSEASGTIEMPALGRPFSLGMLYDCRYDKFIPGKEANVSLMNSSAINTVRNVASTVAAQ